MARHDMAGYKRSLGVNHYSFVLYVVILSNSTLSLSLSHSLSLSDSLCLHIYTRAHPRINTNTHKQTHIHTTSHHTPPNRLCRHQKSSPLWVSLASAALGKRQLDTAEIALAEINEVTKVRYGY